eukprot:5975715-Prymnesium_polylepis.1
MEGEKMGERPRWHSGKVIHPTATRRPLTTADDHPECPACHHPCSPPVPASQVTKKELWLQYTKSCDVSQQPTQ